MSNRIQLENKADYQRALQIERDLVEETGWIAPEQKCFVTYPIAELAKQVRARLTEEGIAHQ